jgi:monoamine oxidase
LQTYLRGEFSEKMTVLDEKTRVAKTLDELERLFPKTKENFIGGLSKCWSEDPFVEGAWAHFGSTKDSETAKRSENRIFFAGEHLSDFGSWMQGALQSSLRTVGEIEKINV